MQDRIINKVMKAHFLSPVYISPLSGPADEAGKVVVKEEITICFTVIENTTNQKSFLAFTDWDELGKWENRFL
jgi:hypothetical protein